MEGGRGRLGVQAAIQGGHPGPRSKGSTPSYFDLAQFIGFCRPNNFEKSGLPDLYFNAAVRQTCCFKVTGSGSPVVSK